MIPVAILFSLLACDPKFSVNAAAQGSAPTAQAKSDLSHADDGKRPFERICADCHGLALIIDQRHTEDEWRTVVDSMVSRGAQGTDEEFNLIVKYLTKNFGKTK